MKAFGINDIYFYEDKQSGKDLDRLGYQYMKRAFEKSDTHVIKSLDLLGRNLDAIKKDVFCKVVKEIKQTK